MTGDKDNELKSCPFCGGEAEIWEHQDSVMLNHHNDCVIDLVRNYKTKQEAIKAWNTRHDETLQQQNDTLREALESEPTEAMCDNARGVLLGFELGIYKVKDMKLHLSRGGYYYPPYLELMTGEHITKWEQAILIWQCMSKTALDNTQGSE